MKYTYLILIALLISGCANIVPPTGGPVDQTAPRDSTALTYPNSDNNLNFTDDHFDLYFNEPITITNLKANLNSSPQLKEELDVKITKESNKLYKASFSFNETLDSNTTYIIQLGSSIQDLTEGNTSKNPTVVFSTGPYMDSLEFSGTAKKNISNTPASNFIIGLYENHDSITPIEDKPIYFSKVDKQGKFSLTHLKSNTYKVFCFKDDNNNQLYNPNSEPVGFLPGLLDVHKNIDTSIITFLTVEDSIQINPIRHRIDKSVLTTTQAPKKITIDTKTQFVQITSTEWHFINSSADSLIANITITDSLNNEYKESTYIPPHQINTSTKPFKLKHPKFQREYTGDKIQVPIVTPLPIDQIDIEKILVVTEHDTLPLNQITHAVNQIKSNEYSIVLTNVSDTGAIHFNPESVTDIKGASNNQSILNYYPLNPENYGTIGAKVITNYEHYFVQILNSKRQIFKTLDSPKTIELKNIKPDQYYIRVLIDIDNDGLYNYGSFSKAEQPEPIYYYPDPIKLKPNWEIMDITISF